MRVCVCTYILTNHSLHGKHGSDLIGKVEQVKDPRQVQNGTHDRSLVGMGGRRGGGGGGGGGGRGEGQGSTATAGGVSSSTSQAIGVQQRGGLFS